MRKTVSSRLRTIGFEKTSIANTLGHSTFVNDSNYAFDMTNDVQKKNGFRKQYNANFNNEDNIHNITRESEDIVEKFCEALEKNNELKNLMELFLAKAN